MRIGIKSFRLWAMPPLLLIALMAAALSLVPAYAAGPPAGKGPATHIVVFHQGVDPGAASRDLAARHGLVPELVYSHALSGASFIIPPGREDNVRSDPRVAFIERNQVVRAFDQNVPTGIRRSGADLNSTANINGIDQRVDVDIAIIDTGIYLAHPDLNVYRHVNCARGGPFGGQCRSGSSEGNDGDGHGTHVAGTAAALDNSIGVVGVAPGARLWAVRVLDNNGSGYMSWIIGGVDYVAANSNEIDVANMSLGCECTSTALNTSIASAVSKGVVFVVAAGNEMNDAATFSPANHPDVITVSAIADFDGIPGGEADQVVAFSICTVDKDDSFACFSNYGDAVDIAAPGVNILSTWNNGGYATISGTSMASPHVAGAAALHIAANGKPTSKDGVFAVRDALIAAATPQDHADGYSYPYDHSNPAPLLNVADTPPPPPAPVADAGPDQTVSDADGDGMEMVTLNGSGSFYLDGEIISYDWYEGDSLIATGATPTVAFAVGTHTVTLVVTSDDDLTDSDEVVITVTPNQPPVANAGPDQTVTDSDGDGTEMVDLNGTASSDPDGEIVSYEWFAEGNNLLAEGPTPTVAFAIGSHTVTLIVTDNGGASSSDSVTITVNDASAVPTMSVSDISYSTEGGRNQNQHLAVTATVEDGNGNPVGGAAIVMELRRNGSLYATASGTTGSNGMFAFKATNAPSGSYTVVVTSLTHPSLTWDGETPANGFTK